MNWIRAASKIDTTRYTGWCWGAAVIRKWWWYYAIVVPVNVFLWWRIVG